MEKLIADNPRKWQIWSHDQREFDGTFTWWVHDPRDPGHVVLCDGWLGACDYVARELAKHCPECGGNPDEMLALDMCQDHLQQRFDEHAELNATTIERAGA